MNNKILDYEQVEEKLQQIASEGVITKHKDLGTTTYGLPIHHYTLGKGKKEIVITGATHGCEIISTDFVLNLMENLSQSDNQRRINLDEYTLHFIPMLNPEGYLISTSAIRRLIPRDMPADEAEKICKEYYMQYRQDDIDAVQRRKEGLEPDRTTQKHFQKMFEDVDYTCIPEKYSEIRENVRRIYEKYPDIPSGTMQIWSANANGIDPQANCEYNGIIDRILSGEAKERFKDNLRYSNISTIHPGPINCGVDPEKGFELEPEIKAISSLLEQLHEKGTLYSYFNYHGTGGMLYQRPWKAPANLEVNENEMWTRTLENFTFSKLYAGQTYKNENDKEHTRYRILTGIADASSSNDIFRIKYPKDILVELSGMGGNPIGPYGDLEGNYKNLMNSNLDAFFFSLEYSDVSDKMAKKSYSLWKEKLKDGVTEDSVQQIYKILGTTSNIMISWINRFGRASRWQVVEQGLKRTATLKKETQEAER